MSKKKNKKFKRHKSHGVHKPQNHDSHAVTPQVVDEVADETKEVVGKSKAVKSEPPVPAEDNERYSQVRGETKKVLIILFVLFLLLVGTYFLNQETSTLNALGDWIYRVANIQTQ